MICKSLCLFLNYDLSLEKSIGLIKVKKTAIFSLFELYLIQFETKLNKLIFQDSPKLPFPTLLNLF